MKIRCPICPKNCALEEGQTGPCRARINRNGQITCANYAQITSLALDPIEKKPLAHFHPGAQILSIGSYGCNLHCPFCQNASISSPASPASPPIPTQSLPPPALADLALSLVPKGNIGLAYTYNEPLISYEFIRDCATEIHQRRLLNVAVTNGMIRPDPLQKLLPLLDALNIDLKAFSQDFYSWIGGTLKTVLQTIRLSVEAHRHVEITTLIIPGHNDSPDLMKRQAAWIASLSPEIPLHITRFFPAHHCLNLPPTPIPTIHALVQIASHYLHHVHPGNC